MKKVKIPVELVGRAPLKVTMWVGSTGYKRTDVYREPPDKFVWVDEETVRVEMTDGQKSAKLEGGMLF